MDKIIIDIDKCKGCGFCIDYCPKKSLDFSSNFNKIGYHPAKLINNNTCTSCGFCFLVCPDMCIEVYKPASITNKSDVGEVPHVKRAGESK